MKQGDFGNIYKLNLVSSKMETQLSTTFFHIGNFLRNVNDVVLAFLT